eukprot:SAG31_NODE_8133_length_1515_cov_1.038136_3_plen_77_part_00
MLTRGRATFQGPGGGGGGGYMRSGDTSQEVDVRKVNELLGERNGAKMVGRPAQVVSASPLSRGQRAAPCSTCSSRV